jgi:hypothetical protein
VTADLWSAVFFNVDDGFAEEFSGCLLGYSLGGLLGYFRDRTLAL